MVRFAFKYHTFYHYEVTYHEKLHRVDDDS